MLANSRPHRSHFVLIVDKAWVMRLLRHFCKVTPLAEAHSDLFIGSLHILTHLLGLNDSTTINTAQDLLETVIDGVRTVKVLILHGKRFFQFSHTRWLPKLFLVTYCP